MIKHKTKSVGTNKQYQQNMMNFNGAYLLSCEWN